MSPQEWAGVAVAGAGVFCLGFGVGMLYETKHTIRRVDRRLQDLLRTK